MWNMPNARQLNDAILCGGQPTEADLKLAAHEGYTTVVNLRPDTEMRACGIDEVALTRSHGLSYHVIPIASPDDLTVSAAQSLDTVLASATGRVLVHCGSANRVGALFAIRANAIEGLDPSASIDKGRQAGLTALEGAVRTLLR